jgi:Arc/MetJ-type ribon-helix-helix transcriptional regulator
MPASQYGEPKFPVRLSYATSADQEAQLRALAGTDEFESLGDCIRTLLEEALTMREDITKATDEYAATEEGSEVCEVVTTPKGTALVRGPRSLTAPDVDGSTRRGVPHGLSRVGDNLTTERRPAMSRAELIAQERGER